MKSDERGSIWRRWDLHFHTPSSYDYKKSGITNLDIVNTLKANNVVAVAITDHHRIDVDRIRDLQGLAKGDITFFPGIELRSELGGTECVHFIGIFPEDFNLEEIRDKIAGKLNLTASDIERIGNDKVYCDFIDTAGIIHELGGIVSVHAGSKTNSLENIANTPHFKQKIKEDIAKEAIDILEIGDINDCQTYLEIVFPDIKHEFPLVMCSDNHNINNYETKSFLWIKSDVTFEGLRQITFEPRYRVHLGERQPVDPIYSVRKLVFNFPSGTSIGSDDFCFRGNHEINFSQNLTTLIGGRGTGKSMVLNLLQEKVSRGSNDFLKEHPLSGASVDGCVKVEGTGGLDAIEFISQNEIDTFATDTTRLTGAIYKRLILLDKGEIAQAETQLRNELKIIDDIIGMYESKEEAITQLTQLKSRQSKLLAAVKSLTDPDYMKLSKGLEEVSTRLERLKASSRKLASLISRLQQLLKEFTVPASDLNEYDIFIGQVLDSLQTMVKGYFSGQAFSAAKTSEATLADLLVTLRDGLEKYLSDKGLSQESLVDVTKAQGELVLVNSQIDQWSESLSIIEKSIAESVFDGKSYDNYTKSVEKSIMGLLKVDDEKGTIVEPITLEYGFDRERALKDLFSRISDRLPVDEKGAKLREDYVSDCLFSIPPEGLRGYEEFFNELRSLSQSKTFEAILGHFSSENEYEIYKLMSNRIFMDAPKYQLIKVLYGGRPLQNSSYGQRCTAALVVLLQLGNSPLVIDEPENHLDSLLIARYLVKLIKEKKQNRQIIFATHNANFVVNADAELINILSMDAAKMTKVTPSTIENLDNRDDLVALEGGKDAFVLREGKYRIQK